MQTVGDEQKTSNQEKTKDVAKPVENDIYTMPKEFYMHVKKESHVLRNSIIIIVVLIIVFGGATAYVLLTRDEGGGGEEVPITPELLLQQQQEKDDANETPEPINPVIEDTTIIDQNEDDSNSTPGASNDDTSQSDTLETIPVALPASVDLDGDGLTDVEENLLGIDKAEPDTDGDGFFDGAELLAGYDPSRPTAQINTSGIFASFVNEEPSFNVQVPSAWSQQRTEGETDTITFTAINNDSVVFTVVENSENITVEQWHRTTYPNRNLNELTNRTISGKIGKESILRREVYIPLEDYILIVRYDVGNKQEIAYPAIFEFIIDSITF